MSLVDKQEAIKLLRGKCVGKYPSSFLMGLFAAADEIAKLPEVEAVPMVHGKWEIIGEEYVNCTNCGTIYEALPTAFAFKLNNKFCRNCGAKMDKEEVE